MPTHGSVVKIIQSFFRWGAMGVGSDIRNILTIMATRANVPASSNDARVLFVGKSVNIIAARAAPKVWPSMRAVPSIPLAPPLRCCGAEETMMLLLGD